MSSQLALLDGAPQRLLEPEALRGRIEEGRAAERDAVAPELLGAKQATSAARSKPSASAA